MAPHFRHTALFIGPNARAAVNDGRADYVPVLLSDVPRLFESGALPLDAGLVDATPPNASGFSSLGVSLEAAGSVPTTRCPSDHRVVTVRATIRIASGT